MRALAILLLAATAWCADPFPSIEGDNLLGKKVALPAATNGQPAVVVIGFTRSSQAQIKTWRDQLPASVPAWSIAMLEDAPRLVRGMAVAGIKSGVPENRRDHFLIVVKYEKELKAALGFSRPDDAYLALIDKDGTIRWRFHGAFNETALKDLLAEIPKP